ncbi:MAG: OadG family protein [Desulfobacterales bacterium]
MFGFENISANNGWAMAAVGASIVFLGLVVLSLVISQVHKILKLWERRDEEPRAKEKQAPVEDLKTKKAPGPLQRHLPTVKELTSIYRPLVEQLKQPFELLQLFEISNKMDLPHPHLSIRYLQEAGILTPQGDGTFTWDKQKAS